MEAKLVSLIRAAAGAARDRARMHPGALTPDQLPWAVIKAWDDDVRGHVERDPRIEDARDHVLITAVDFAETPPETEPERVGPARDRLLAAIDRLERTVLRLGIVNRRAAALGYGEAGQRLDEG
ncbi:conserved hypothetical protein [Methylobacterium sp. 4-46]|uniref:hypothetical protein n=1 Tax=unclassified Methylobacterium TaxID=2615210 RepID=UPI000152D602|nr:MULTISPECIES: hypothetical protein [Methylobacterium]ACA20909.1 conserved hypothetical protein [Methylobacterium sp. 4-46]WFT80062.1 hypothetical protein QA634_33615 [Methylobacterium nodulans]